MFGDTVKLVDFGLATTEPISSDFGCGSTFYLSPGMYQSTYVPEANETNEQSTDSPKAGQGRVILPICLFLSVLLFV